MLFIICMFCSIIAYTVRGLPHCSHLQGCKSLLTSAKLILSLMKEIHIKAVTKATPKNHSYMLTDVLNLALRALLIPTLGFTVSLKEG